MTRASPQWILALPNAVGGTDIKICAAMQDDVSIPNFWFLSNSLSALWLLCWHWWLRLLNLHGYIIVVSR